uniref:Uncharacterized protein n=1 Tax=Rhizophora mucronata TaxID=61149 RepID=A0A2P2NTC3_RHIMU
MLVILKAFPDVHCKIFDPFLFLKSNGTA